MNRVETLRNYIDRILVNINDSEEKRSAYLHLYGVAQSAALLAMKRGEDVELAMMAGMLHDIYSYEKMISINSLLEEAGTHVRFIFRNIKNDERFPR